MDAPLPFYSLYRHGLVRVAVCIPFLRVADPIYNTERTLALAQRAAAQHAAVALFPELGLSAYSNDDLFHQDALLESCLEAINRLLEASRSLTPVLLVGAPLKMDGRLFNCGVVIYRGQLLGIVPKTYLPNYREFYEKRQLVSSREAIRRDITLFGQQVPVGNDLLFEATTLAHFVLHVEICEDAWVPIPPSTYGALGGATILANLSASNITIGKADYRRRLCAALSSRCVAAYLYSAAGPGESTTDLAWDGYALIYENNELLAEAERFTAQEQVITADIDVERLIQERLRLTSFSDTVMDYREKLQAMRRIPFAFQIPTEEVTLRRVIARFPYVPNETAKRDERCFEAYHIQVHGLLKRLQHTGIERVVIGISGGLDSTQALIVAARTFDQLKLPRCNILAYTLPGFATSQRTLTNAHQLMQALGVTAQELDIKPSCLQMLKDIGHPFAAGELIYDITFENVQAGERTSHLFRLANFHHALVLGTGDLSELALGWSTYGVGDHMSHYNVNASVPKTLIQHLLRWVIDTQQFDAATCQILQAIVDTEISPELIPAQGTCESDYDTYDQSRQTNPSDVSTPSIQSTQAVIGPYELQDFNLYYITRYGFRPSKVAFLSHHAWHDKTQGAWPIGLPVDRRNEYDLATIKKWLEVFLYRFLQTSQYKRTCVPNSPKVGSGGSLSPRGDWRAPSDSEARIWLEELRRNVP